MKLLIRSPVSNACGIRRAFLLVTMGRNTLPSKISELFTLAEEMAHKLEANCSSNGTSGILARDFRHILDEARELETTWSTARSAKASAQARMTAADEAVTSWLAKARLVMILAHGPKWSERWIEPGFTHRATNVPRRTEQKITLASRLVVFLALHPDFAVPFAGVTAARGRPIYERMIQTRAALELATTNCGAIKPRRDTAIASLRQAMRELRGGQPARAGVPIRSATSITLPVAIQPEPVAA
jgi:hypothetical protein